MTFSNDPPPADWYPDPEPESQSLRWWDGQQWTDQIKAPQIDSPPSNTAVSPPTDNSKVGPVNPDASPVTTVAESAVPRGRPFRTWWIVAAVALVGILIAGAVIGVSSRDSRNTVDASELPKTLDCVILPIDVDDSFTNSARVPNSLLVSGVRAEYISGNRLDLTMNFVDELPPARTTTDPPPGSPQKATYSFIVQLDNTDSSALSVDFAPDGWEIREGVSGSDPFGDDATVNFNPNMTIGPDYVNLIIELDTLAYKPAKLDPTVSVETTRAGPGYDEQPFYATQDCK